MSLSLAALTSLAAQETGEVWLVFIDINHDDLPAPLRFVLDHSSHTYDGSAYLPTWFDVQLMSSEPETMSTAKLNIDAVDQTVLDALVGLQTPPTVDIRVLLASDLTNVLVSQEGLVLRQIDTDNLTLSATLEGPDFFNETVPGVLMNRANTPGIFR